MTLNEMKKNNLMVNEDLKFFVDHLTDDKNFDSLGPVNVSSVLYDALISGDENLTVQVWMSFCWKIAKLFSETDGQNGFRNRYNSYIVMVKHLITSLAKEIKTIEYMKSIRKWTKLIMPELDAPFKVVIYTIDTFLAKELNGIIEYASFSQFLSDEDRKIQVMVKAYAALIEEELKDQFATSLFPK